MAEAERNADFQTLSKQRRDINISTDSFIKTPLIIHPPFIVLSTNKAKKRNRKNTKAWLF